jgi:hypothetical protein
MDPRAGLDAVVKRKIPSPCWDFNPLSSSMQPTTTSMSYPGSNAIYQVVKLLN